MYSELCFIRLAQSMKFKVSAFQAETSMKAMLAECAECKDQSRRRKRMRCTALDDISEVFAPKGFRILWNIFKTSVQPNLSFAGFSHLVALVAMNLLNSSIIFGSEFCIARITCSVDEWTVLGIRRSQRSQVVQHPISFPLRWTQSVPLRVGETFYEWMPLQGLCPLTDIFVAFDRIFSAEDIRFYWQAAWLSTLLAIRLFS